MRFERLCERRFVLLERCGELVLEFGDAFALALDPFGLKIGAFAFEFGGLFAQGGAEAIHFIARGVEIGDEVGGFARGRGDFGAGAFENARGKAEALGDGDAARAAGNADHEAIRRAQIHGVKFDGGVEDAGRGAGVSLQAIVMRGGKREAAARAKFFEQRDGECGAFFGRGAGAELVHEDERIFSGGFEHRAQIEHVRGKSREVGSDGLLVADVREDAVE